MSAVLLMLSVQAIDNITVQNQYSFTSHRIVRRAECVNEQENAIVLCCRKRVNMKVNMYHWEVNLPQTIAVDYCLSSWREEIY